MTRAARGSHRAERALAVSIWLCLVGKRLRRQSPFVRNHLHPHPPQSHGQISSPLSSVNLSPDRRLLAGNRPTPERPQPPCTSFSPDDDSFGPDLILSRPSLLVPSLRPVAMDLLRITTGPNPTIPISLVVALRPTPLVEEMPKPQRFRPKSTTLLESCATTSRR